MSFDHAFWCGKMFPDCCLPIMAAISQESFAPWQTSVISEPSGVWMGSTSACPNDDDVYSACLLASVLETAGDWLARHPGKKADDWLAYVQRYFLSARAALGILRRAARRGRTLPAHLEAALRAVAGPTTSIEPEPSSPSKPPPCAEETLWEME